MRFLLFLTVPLIATLTGPFAEAASCCGGGFSIPALILGDDKAQMTGTYSYSQVSDDVLANGRWLRRDDKNLAQTLKLEGATLLSDTWQAGITLPVLSKTAENQSPAAGLGDVSLYLGHETFPETIFSRFRPKGVTFLQLSLPTSPSIYDEDSTQATAIRGRGFYSLGFGLALLKSYTIWDFNFSAELHRSFSRSTSSAAYGGNTEIHPGWGTSQNFGAGWNRGAYRVGGFFTFLYEQAIRTEGATASDGQAQKNFTLGAVGSYMINMESALTISYADQSWIGNPVNSSLSKTLNLSYQQRWPR